MVLFIPCHTVPFPFQNAIEIHYMHVLFLFTYSCVDCTVQFSDIDQSSWLNVSHQFVLQLHSINKGKIMTKCHSTHYGGVWCVYYNCAIVISGSDEWLFENSIRSINISTLIKWIMLQLSFQRSAPHSHLYAQIHTRTDPHTHTQINVCLTVSTHTHSRWLVQIEHIGHTILARYFFCVCMTFKWQNKEKEKREWERAEQTETVKWVMGEVLKNL